MPDRFIHLRVGADGYRLIGASHVRLGHPIDRGPGNARDGVFLEWDWDGARLVVVNDRYALYPLYYFERPGEICLATSFVRLLEEGAPRELDDAAIAVFLRFGAYIGQDTALRHVRQAPPGARLEWDRTGLRLSAHLPIVKAVPRSERVAAADYIDAFRAAIGRRLPDHEDFALPLSGGRDSRHILFELLRAGRRPAANLCVRHYPPRPNYDSRLAQEVCDRAALPLTLLESPRPRIAAEIRKNRATDFATMEHAWGWAVADFLAGRFSSVFDGINGGMLFGRHGGIQRSSAAHIAGGHRHAVETMITGRGFSEPALAALLNERYRRRFSRDLAFDRVSAELEKHGAAANPVQSFYFWSRVCRHTNLYSVGMMPEIAVLCPFLDPDVHDFALSLPREIALDETFQGRAIHAAYPEMADIPFEPLHYAMTPEDRWHNRRNAADLAIACVRHGHPEMVATGFMASRLARVALTGNLDSVRWWKPLFALVMVQLDQALGAPSAPQQQLTGPG